MAHVGHFYSPPPKVLLTPGISEKEAILLLRCLQDCLLLLFAMVINDSRKIGDT